MTGDAHFKPLNWSRHGDEGGTHWDNFPSVALPMEDCRLWVARGGPLNRVAARERFDLWGLTLRVVNELLLLGGLRRGAIDAAAVTAAVTKRKAAALQLGDTPPRARL